MYDRAGDSDRCDYASHLGWKIALFSVIMLVVGIIMPAIWRAKCNAD